MIQVPAADVFEALDLVSKLVNLKPGEAVDHKWGYIKREETTGFRVADPGQAGAEGNWRGHNAVALVSELYETHLVRKES